MSVPPLIVSAAVEGLVDEAVIRRLLLDAAALSGTVYVTNGKSNLKKKVNAYNQAARRFPWILLVDLNREADCAPALRARWLPWPNELMCFRVAVREVEAWLLADRQSMSQFLGVTLAKVPQDPDSLDNPKGFLVDLARRSRFRDLREDMVPRPASGRSEGPAYASRMIEFAGQHWRPSVAEKSSESLRRCRKGIDALGTAWAAFTRRSRG